MIKYLFPKKKALSCRQIPFVQNHSGNNSKIIFTCICICCDLQIISKIICRSATLPPPSKLQRTAVSASATRKNSKIILVCICICYGTVRTWEETAGSCTLGLWAQESRALANFHKNIYPLDAATKRLETNVPWHKDSRLSFPATDPPAPQKGFRMGLRRGSLKGSLKGFRRVLQGF